MCQSLVHRGPDYSGIYTAPGVGLGHRRLKVIDLPADRQPMTDSSGRYTLALDGEIYSYAELRQALAQAGYVFSSRSGTEVLLYGLIDHGLDFLHRVNGMFAFALWDDREKELLLVRDRFGVKPLYWAVWEGGLVFASEASSIMASGFLPPVLNQASRSLFLALSYIPGENSIFAGVKRLPPGSWLRFSAGRGLQTGTWWEAIEYWRRGREAGLSITDWRTAFRDILEDAVSSRMVSDVPLGVLLSGGLDSAVVAALMRRAGPEVNAFTMAFADPSHNEAPQAKATAKALDLRYFEELADLSAPEALADLAASLDEPFADTSIIPIDALCRLARRQATVVLSGDGADELLAGYITLQADEIYGRLLKFPPGLVLGLRRLVNLLPDSRRKVNIVFRLKQFLAAYPRDEAMAHASWRLLFYPEALRELFPETDDVADVFSPFLKAWDEAADLPRLDRLLYVDYKTWLPDDILVKTDRASMRHGLELRSPFLDYRLFNLCAGLPAGFKRNGGQGKMILRQYAAALLPRCVLHRPKRGFNTPVADWLSGSWRGLAEQEFTMASLEGCGLRPEPVRKMWAEHLRERKNHGFQLFNIIMYCLWFKSAFKRPLGIKYTSQKSHD